MLLSFITRKVDNPMALLVGYAGTGKTFLVNKLIKSIRQAKHDAAIAVAAPTHKAVKVFRKEAVKGVDYATIHSLLGLKEQRDGDTVTFAPDKFRKEPPPLNDYNVLLLDEVSMLNSEIFRMLLPYLHGGLRIVFIGDAAQIPPIGEIDAVPLLKWQELKLLKCELTQIMRQADGNPILDFATEVRTYYKEKVKFHPRGNLVDGKGIELVDIHSPREQEILMEFFDSQQFQADPDWMKVIAWRNKTVDEYNKRIRQIIYHQPYLPAVMQGEKLIMDKPVFFSNKLILSTNEEVDVEDVCITGVEVRVKNLAHDYNKYQFKVYQARVGYWDRGVRRWYQGYILHEDETERFEKLKEAMATIAKRDGRLWKQFWEIPEQFMWVKYNYAVTGHKSQGSTYDQSLVLKWDIDINRNTEERNRILYVACTRARYKLFIEP